MTAIHRPPAVAADDSASSSAAGSRPTVCFVTQVLTRYRVPFHERVQRLLTADGIDYRLIYGAPSGEAAAKGDTTDLAWATRVGSRSLRLLGRDLHWQAAIRPTRGAALVVASQENKLLVNYWFQLRHLLGKERFAFWGHGRNLQSDKPDGWSERLKRRLALHAHWWFAYTPSTGRFVRDLGFPADRITVFNNAVDTAALGAERDAVTPEQVAAFRRRHDLGAGPIGIYLGAMYADKRLAFLIEAAALVHRRLPAFRLVLVGAGPEAAIAEAAAARYGFVRNLGPRFGHDKALCAAASRVLLLPGAVGLAVLDSFAFGLPLVTVAGQRHGPEIEYLEDGVNGVVVAGETSAAGYADAVVALLGDSDRHAGLCAGARASAGAYSIDAMAERFCTGVRSALGRDASACS